MSKEREPASGAAEGARRATGGAPEERRDGRGRWSAKRKFAAVLRLLRGEDLETLSRELGVTAATLSGWRPDALWSGGGRSHEPRRFALHGTTLRRGARDARMGDGAFQLLLSARNRRTTWANARAAGTHDRLERRGVAREDPRAAGGLAVLRRGPSQSVGATALRASAHVEGAGAAADARSAVAGAVPHVSEGRESAHRHDHHGAA